MRSYTTKASSASFGRTPGRAWSYFRRSSRRDVIELWSLSMCSCRFSTYLWVAKTNKQTNKTKQTNKKPSSSSRCRQPFCAWNFSSRAHIYTNLYSCEQHRYTRGVPDVGVSFLPPPWNLVPASTGAVPYTPPHLGLCKYWRCQLQVRATSKTGLVLRVPINESRPIPVASCSPSPNKWE